MTTLIELLQANVATAAKAAEQFPLTTPLVVFGIHVVFAWVITHFFYYRKSHRREFYFTFLVISLAIFFLMFSMIFMADGLKGKKGIGIGIGLFGILSVMRYRTDTMPVREMTYMFSLICLAVVNALFAGQEVFTAFTFVPNVAILIAIMICEAFLLRKDISSKLIKYDRVDLIMPEKRQELIADLKKRTGVDITRVEIGSIDYLRDMAYVKIFFERDAENNFMSDSAKVAKSEWQNVDDDD